MTHRLYFTLPDVSLTQAVVDELLAAGIPRSQLHAVASHALDLEDLPEAGILQTSQFKHGLEAGIGVGGVAGFLGGLLAVTFPPGGLVLGGAALAVGALAGAGFGAVVGGLVAHDIPNDELKAFEADVINGHVLLLVDVPASQVDEFKQLILGHHPDADIRVTDSPKPR